MEGTSAIPNFFRHRHSAVWNPSKTHCLSPTKYSRLLAEQLERCRAAALEYMSCTEVYNAGENCNEQPENVSLPGATLNGESAAGSSTGHTNTVGHVLPEVGAFAVQCASCLKWRIMPSKEKYEAIRECILECPWFCEDASPWRQNASCDDPADIVPDERFLWALDKPNISVPPPGWDRQFIIRSRGASKLGDIYYVSPCGKKLRSIVEVGRFLNEHPHYVMEGVRLDRFSYKTPKPLFDGYVGKRKRSGVSDADGPSKKMRGAQNFQRNINTTQVKPFARREHGESSSMSGDAHFDGSGSKLTDKSDAYIQRPLFPEQFSKKKRSSRMRPTAIVTNWSL